MTYKVINNRMNEEDKDSLVQKFMEAGKIIDPFAINLNAAERKSIPVMGLKTIGFTEMTLGIARNHPEYVPQYQDLSLQLANLQFSKQLHEVLEVVEPIYEKIRDTWMAAGAEAYLAARVFYDSIKAASKQGVAGSDAIARELGIIFKRRRKKEKSE